jgi:hypothetical protein
MGHQGKLAAAIFDSHTTYYHKAFWSITHRWDQITVSMAKKPIVTEPGSYARHEHEDAGSTCQDIGSIGKE